MSLTDSAIGNINRILSTANADGRGSLYEYEVYQVLSELGLAVPHTFRNQVFPFQQYGFTYPTCHAPDSLANLLVGLGLKYQKPMVISVNAGRHYQDFVSIMEENGLPVYIDIRAAIKSLDTFVTYHLNHQ